MSCLVRGVAEARAGARDPGRFLQLASSPSASVNSCADKNRFVQAVSAASHSLFFALLSMPLSEPQVLLKEGARGSVQSDRLLVLSLLAHPSVPLLALKEALRMQHQGGLV